MEYTTFGRTGLRVSVAGLGCGGNSALGLAKGGSEADAIAVVHKAIDLGINIFDTAHQYETEVALGKAIKGKRDGLVICTKTGSRQGNDVVPTSVMLAELDQSLRDLDVDCIDVFQLQGVAPAHYDRLMAEHVPLLLKERDKGKFRFLGISEHLREDIQHSMSSRAVHDTVWDSMMVGYHMLNQRPRLAVFPQTRENGIGVLIMYAVRQIFSRRERLLECIAEAAADGRLPAAMADEAEPLARLMSEGGAKSLTDAAYRFVHHTPGCDVTLFGTSSLDHVADNVASILSPPLPTATVAWLHETFGHLTGVGLDGNGRPAGWGEQRADGAAA
jgi:aryl-alcohol dehydrogenase-like predicted oxidoreductase